MLVNSIQFDRKIDILDDMRWKSRQIDKNVLVAKAGSDTMIITIIYMTRGTEIFHHEIFFSVHPMTL